MTELAHPGATLLMLAFAPNRLPGIPGGVAVSEIEKAYAGWELLSTEPADTSGMPGADAEDGAVLVPLAQGFLTA